MKIVGYTVGTSLPKPDFKQTDPKKGDYIKNKPDFDGLQTTIENVSELVGDTAVSEQITNALKTEAAYFDTDAEVTEGIPAPIDADTLGGKPASEYATKNEVSTNYLLKTETAVNANMLGGKPPEAYTAVNLLDNSDWRIKKNIVNQRGQTGYNGNNYAIDRWKLWSDNGNGSVTIEDGWLACNPGTSSAMSIAQKFEKGVLDPTKTYTLAWCDHANQIHVHTNRVSYDSTYDYVDFGITEWVGIKWVALYEGSYTAETLPPYVPKGYAAEFAECRRYYRKLIHFAARPYHIDSSVRYYRVLLEPPMRDGVNPSVGIIELLETPSNSWDGTNATFGIVSTSPNSFTISATSNVSYSDYALRADVTVSSDL